jgi:N-acetyl-alpha-D-glucosaminyl L-malate synthase BshA
VTAVSRFLREKTLTNYGIEKEIEVIPNFVDAQKYKRAPCEDVRRHFAPEGEKIVVHTSNFRKVKRVDDAIRIFHQVRKKIPAKLLLVGDGPERSQCELLCRELDIQDYVRFLGKQMDIVRILCAADLFLMPSQSESFGLSALEAMACEVPVISSSVGGLPELQVHGKTGYIAEIGDVDRMARYAIDLLSNPAKHQLFAHAARERALDFESSKIVTMYERYYEKILAGSEIATQ